MRIQKSKEVKKQVQGRTARQRTMSQPLTGLCSPEQAPSPHLFITVAIVAFSEPTRRVGRISSSFPRWGMLSGQWGVWFRLLLLVCVCVCLIQLRAGQGWKADQGHTCGAVHPAGQLAPVD